MKKLAKREKEIMSYYWQYGALFVRELLDKFPEPKPHFNTLSTITRLLEKNGFLAHHTYGNTYQYYPIITEDDYRKQTLNGIIHTYFHNSYLSVVSSLVQEEKISVQELKELIAQIENPENQ